MYILINYINGILAYIFGGIYVFIEITKYLF